MNSAQIGGLILAGIWMTGCSGPEPTPPAPMPMLSLRDAMIQTVDALAATRAHAAQRRIRACGVEAVFHVTASAPGADATAIILSLAHPDEHEGPHSSTVTLTLDGDNCDEPPPSGRRGPVTP